MKGIRFTMIGWEEYTYWQSQDKRTLRKINELIKSIMRDGLMEGTGKPEPLKYRPGYSRRIDEKNRLVYDVDKDGSLVILACHGHYEDS